MPVESPDHAAIREACNGQGGSSNQQAGEWQNAQIAAGWMLLSEARRQRRQ